MAKLTKKKLVNLIENLINQIVENKVEKLVEERVQKITPMLVEHEVNRILRENNVSANAGNGNNMNSNNAQNDKVDDNVDVDRKRGQLREHFKSLVNGDSPTPTHGGGGRGDGNGNAMMNSNTVAPQTTPDGKRVDMNNEAVQRVANVMNQDFSDTVKKLNENSKKRNGQLPN